MADVTMHIVTPAATGDLVTLQEAKIMVGLADTDTSADEQLTFLISTLSAVIADECNRGAAQSIGGFALARETLIETWREIETDNAGTRVFLTHWPVNAADVVSVSCNGVDLDPTAWDLEESSGKLSYYGGYSEPVEIAYTGGYNLPDEAPLALKHAMGLALREARRQILFGSIEGIRSISHKSARVQFIDPTRALGVSGGVKGSPSQIAINNLIRPYIRFWV